MADTFKDKVDKHIELGQKLNLEASEVAFSIIHSAENFDDCQIEAVFASLPEEIKNELLAAINSYKETGEYYVISSTGVSKDLSELMGRLSKLI